MDPALLIKWAMTVSLLLIVFGLGLQATFADAAFLFRHLFRSPHRLLRAIAAMFLVVPAIAVAMAMMKSFSAAVPGWAANLWLRAQYSQTSA